MKRLAMPVLVVIVGCSGPIALEEAIWSVHSQEYDEAVDAVAETPRDAWYAYQARRQQRTIEEVRAADEAIPTTKNPFNARTEPEAVSRGAVIYQANCMRCHGADVRGGGPGMLATHPTKDFHGFGKRFAVTLHGGAPRSWFRKISEGHGDWTEYPEGRSRAMPAFGDTLAREQIWLVITYLQSLDIHAQPDPEPADG